MTRSLATCYPTAWENKTACEISIVRLGADAVSSAAWVEPFGWWSAGAPSYFDVGRFRHTVTTRNVTTLSADEQSI